jgi:hypothetical protein
VRLWFRRTKNVRRLTQSAGDRKRLKHLPAQVEPRSARTSHRVSPRRAPEGGRDTDRDFIIRYGDPFDG